MDISSWRFDLAKRKRTFSLDTLVAELSELDSRRKALVNRLSAAIRSLAGGESLRMPETLSRRRRPAGRAVVKRKGVRKRKMSAAARKRISEAQKRRWAKAKGQK